MVQAYFIGMIIVYAIGTVILGFLAKKKTKTIEDYTIAGQKIGPFFVALSLVATAYSVALYMGYPGWAYQWGYSTFWFIAGMGSTTPLGWFIFMKRYRYTMGNTLSLPDYLGRRYNSNFMRGLAACVCLAIVAYVASQYAGMAKLFDAYLHTGYNTALVIVIIIATVYLFFGGTYADIYTDVAQMLVMAFASVLVFIYGFILIGGGFGKLHTMLAAQGSQYIALTNPASAIAYSPYVIVINYIMNLMIWTWPQINKFAMSLERKEDLKKCFYYIILFNFMAILIPFGGLFARALGVVVTNIDYALPTLLLEYFPGPIAAVVALAILAAGMSTTDTEVIVISTAISHDIYRKILHQKELDDPRVNRNSLIIARVVVVLVALFSLVILYYFPPWSVGLLMWIGTSALIGALAGPLLLGMFWRRGTPIAAIISAISGIAIYIPIMWFKLIRSPFVVAVTCAAIGISIYVIVSLATRPMPSEHLAQFFPEKVDKK